MPRPKKSVPTYSLHKPTGQAYVRLPDGAGGRSTVYLGPHDSPESRAAYARLVADLRTAPTPANAGPRCSPVSVNEVLLRYLDHAERYYRLPDGTPTTEQAEIRRSLRPLRELYGDAPAADFGPKKLAVVRDRMVADGWCRTLINRRVDRVKRCFKWAAAEELVPVTAYEALRTVPGLRAGRTDARESAPVAPVPAEHFAATLPFLPRVPRAMAELQWVTGMRPGEVCRLTLAELDTSGPVWVYRPARHKTRHRGKVRAVAIGPQGQAAILRFLAGRVPAPDGLTESDFATPAGRRASAERYDRAHRPAEAALLRAVARPVVLIAGAVLDPGACLFDPRRDRDERFAALRAKRKSRVTPSEAGRRTAAPARVPATRYGPHAFATAVRRACEKAEVPPWHPNALRHAFATRVRKGHGLEAAQVLLGHSRADVTQVYAERDEALAQRVAAEVG